MITKSNKTQLSCHSIDDSVKLKKNQLSECIILDNISSENYEENSIINNQKL